MKKPATPVKSSEADLARLRFGTLIHIIDTVCALLGTLIRVVGVLGVGYFVMRSIEFTAGKQTKLEAMFSAVLDMSADRYVAWVAVAVFGGGFFHQRNLRKKTIKNMGETIKELEETIDPERSSSNLTEAGRSRKEDRDAS